MLALMLLLTGCTFHPAGEPQERQDAQRAGAPFAQAIEERNLPDLPPNPTPEDLVDHALLANADLERRYWEWRAAIEQIPQDGTQPTNLALSGGTSFTRGRASLDSTTLSLGNDPMADIVLPAKLSTVAARALETARAAGLRFRKAQFDLRAKVLGNYADYALTAELIRFEQSNLQLLQTTTMVVEARNQTGAAGQSDLLRSRNETELSRNEIARLQAQIPVQQASLNALLDRAPDAPIPPPAQVATVEPIALSDQQILQLAASRNPELHALADEVAARGKSVTLARLQYLPDFSLSAGTDLAGITQSLMGMITLPLLRHEAIDAAVAQAQANLRGTQAMRRQAHNDLSTQVIIDLTTLRDAERQLDLFEHTILPRAQQIVDLTRSSYESGRSSLLDVLDAQRSLISLRKLAATLRAARQKSQANLEAAIGEPLRRNE